MTRTENSALGKATEYNQSFSPSILYPIPRKETRAKLQQDCLNFVGEDVWTCYEMSWLKPSGLPTAAVARFRIPCHSHSIVESKSFKLYLNALNNTRFDSSEVLQSVLKEQLSEIVGAEVGVEVLSLSDTFMHTSALSFSSTCIDDVRLSEDAFVYQPDPTLLAFDAQAADGVEECLYSNLLRSNCPVTNQPDWGSVVITYKGRKICHESLLRYIVSFRECQDFHEHCVERMFSDLRVQLGYESLSVYARYTRRGGLDINPYRASPDRTAEAPVWRTLRQ